MVRWLRAVAYTLVFYAGSLIAVPWALVLARFAPARVPSHVAGWGRFHQWSAATLLGVRSRIDGVMPSGPMIIAMKHQAMFETLEVLALFDRPAVVMKRELADIPLFGAAVRAHGSIPISREAGPAAMRTMTTAGRKALAEGRPILIFPEGTRVPPGERPALKPGFAGLYRMLGVPVVPVALDSGQVWPRGSFTKGPGVVTFRIGEPIPPGLSRAEVEARVHTAINALERDPA